MVFIPSKSNSSPFVESFVLNGIQVEVFAASFSFVGREEVYRWMQGEDKPGKVTLVVWDVSNRTILIRSVYVIFLFSITKSTKKYRFFSEW